MTNRLDLLERLGKAVRGRPNGAELLYRLLPTANPIIRAQTGYGFTMQGPSNNAVMLNISLLQDATPYEPMSTLLILLTTSRGGSFIDIGANIGYFSLLASANANNRLVAHAFEPQSLNYRCLEANIKLNNATGVTPYRLALGEETTELEISNYGTGSSLIRGWDGGMADTRGVERVPVRRLDDVLNAPDCPTPIVVKIDAEGYDLPVIRGAERFLSSERVGCVFCEAAHSHHPAGSNPDAVRQIETIAELGYRCFGVIGSASGNDQPETPALIPFEDVDPDDEANWPTNWYCVRNGHPFEQTLDMVTPLFAAFLASHHRSERELEQFVRRLEAGSDESS